MRDILRELIKITDPNPQPTPDLAKCSKCGWKGSVEKCYKGEDGDWESGYFEIDLCSVCEDGGCIDDYDMSEQRGKEWEEWDKNNKIENRK